MSLIQRLHYPLMEAAAITGPCCCPGAAVISPCVCFTCSLSEGLICMQEAESPASSHPAPVHGVSRCQHLAKALIFMGSQHKEIKASLSASRFIPLLINLILEELLEGQTPYQIQRGGNYNWEKNHAHFSFS